MIREVRLSGNVLKARWRVHGEAVESWLRWSTDGQTDRLYELLVRIVAKAHTGQPRRLSVPGRKD
jgi:hypothetical protein